MSEEKYLHFTVEGEFITNMAREKLFVNKDLAGAIRLLRSALCSDEISSDEQLMICLQILHGAMSITGNSDSEDYGLVVRDDIEERPTDLSSIAQLITDMAAENESLKEQNRELLWKMSFLTEQIPEYKLQQINTEYYETTGTSMFSEMRIPSWQTRQNSMDDMLDSFLKQRHREEKEASVCDYGWLEPDGTWHPVEWAHHSEWAGNWLNEHMPFKDPARNMTKAQKEFLYDYYLERERNEEANALYED